MAQGTISLMSAGTGKKVPDVMNRRGLEQTNLSADSVIFFVNLSYDFAIEAVQEFDMSKAYERVKRGNFDESRLAWMMKSFEHQTHHRGQTTIYIRLLGIKPPNEKLF
jgi:DinB family